MMKKSIRKLVAGSLVCAMAAGSAPFLDVSTVGISKVQAATSETKEVLAPDETELYLQEEAYGSKYSLSESIWIYQNLGTTIKISSTDNTIKNVKCTFESSDPDIFTIDDKGVVTPHALGEATLIIHAETEDGKKQTRKQTVDVVEHFVCGGMAYGLISEDELIFLQASYLTKNISRICIPYTINEDVMKVIGKEACAGYKNVKVIEVPESVTKIEDRAFADNDSLEFVMIPAGVTEISDTAFGECKETEGQDTKKVVIKGYKGTEAEKFAKAHEDIVTFEAIEGEYVPYRYIYSMEFEDDYSYKFMEVDEEYQFSVKTYPEVVDEDITYTSEDETVVSVTSGGAAVAKKVGTTQIVATSTTGAQKKIWVSVLGATDEPTETPIVTPTVSPTITPTVSPTATPTISPTVTPIITPTVTPTASPMVTPCADYYAQFTDGDKEWTYGWYPVGGTSYVKMPEVEEREGYHFLYWSNKNGNYQPGEEVGIHDLNDSCFVAIWEKEVQPIGPTTGSAITTSAPTDTLIPIQTPVVEPTPVVTATPTVTNGVATVTSSAIKKLDNAKQKAEQANVEKEEKETNTKDKKVSLKIVTKNKKFVTKKKYTLKVKRTNTKKKVKWSVSNKKIATINAKTGVLKTKKKGEVTITAVCGGVTEKITIRIQ